MADCPAPKNEVFAQYGSNPARSDTRPIAGDTITCDFGVASYAVEDDGKLRAYVDTNEPIVLTFVGLSSKTPKLEGNIGSSSLQLVRDDGDEVVLVERNGPGNVFTYTISRRRRQAIGTKALFIRESPFGLASVGRCY